MSKRNNFFVKRKLVNEEKKFYIACEYGDIEAEDLIFDDFNAAYDFVKNNQETLDNLVNDIYAKKEKKEKTKKEKSKKSKTSKKGGIRRFIAGFLAGVVTLTAGHFIGKGIKETIEERSESKPLEDTLLEENTQEDKFTYNYDENVVTVNNDSYEQLTTEKFEDLTSKVIINLEERGLNLERSDIIKYVMIVNIDKLAQDNMELITQIIGEQNVDEVKQDANRCISAILTYNYDKYFTENSTDNFINVSEAIFDQTNKEKAIEIENRVNALALVVDNNEELNKQVNALLTDLLDPNNKLSYLDAGVGLGLQIALEPVRGLYGVDECFNNTLDEVNTDLIKYFVSYVGDEQEYVDDCLLTGYARDINDILVDCPTFIRSLGK